MYLLLDGNARCATADLCARFEAVLETEALFPAVLNGRVLQGRIVSERQTFSEVRKGLKLKFTGFLDILETIRSGALSKEGFNFFFLADQEVIWVWWTGVNWNMLCHPDQISEITGVGKTDGYRPPPGSLVFASGFSVPESVAA